MTYSIASPLHIYLLSNANVVVGPDRVGFLARPYGRVRGLVNSFLAIASYPGIH